MIAIKTRGCEKANRKRTHFATDKGDTCAADHAQTTLQRVRKISKVVELLV
jgi:hypothetical protein